MLLPKNCTFAACLLLSILFFIFSHPHLKINFTFMYNVYIASGGVGTEQLGKQTVDPFVLSVCPEIKLRIPSLAVCLYVNV